MNELVLANDSLRDAEQDVQDLDREIEINESHNKLLRDRRRKALERRTKCELQVGRLQRRVHAAV